MVRANTSAGTAAGGRHFPMSNSVTALIFSYCSGVSEKLIPLVYRARFIDLVPPCDWI